MSYYNREKCTIDNCNRLQRNKGMINGKKIYGKVCGVHHKRSNGDTETGYHITSRIPNGKCILCGWNKSYCDRHRLVPELGYIEDNIKLLCPNCHRLVTIGLLTI